METVMGVKGGNHAESGRWLLASDLEATCVHDGDTVESSAAMCDGIGVRRPRNVTYSDVVQALAAVGGRRGAARGREETEREGREGSHGAAATPRRSKRKPGACGIVGKNGGRSMRVR